MEDRLFFRGEPQHFVAHVYITMGLGQHLGTPAPVKGFQVSFTEVRNGEGYFLAKWGMIFLASMFFFNHAFALFLH